MLHQTKTIELKCHYRFKAETMKHFISELYQSRATAAPIVKSTPFSNPHGGDFGPALLFKELS
tara:strand:- start:368 stop:556 length:189 start_codon:yes stop_codon:yes gene_type:complete